MKKMFLIDPIEVIYDFLIVGVEFGYFRCDLVISEFDDSLVKVLEETHMISEFTKRFREKGLR